MEPMGFGFESINSQSGSYETRLVIHVSGEPDDLDMKFIVGDPDELNQLMGEDEVYTEDEGMHLFDATKLSDWQAIVAQRGHQFFAHPFGLTQQEMAYETPEQWAEWDRRQAENAVSQGF